MTDHTRERPASWRAAPLLVKAFVIVPVAAGATEWAYGPYVRSDPRAFVLAAVFLACLLTGLVRRNVWAWGLLVLIFLAGVTGVPHLRHPVHRPPGVAIALDLLYVVFLFSPAMLRWVGFPLRRTAE